MGGVVEQVQSDIRLNAGGLILSLSNEDGFPIEGCSKSFLVTEEREPLLRISLKQGHIDHGAESGQQIFDAGRFGWVAYHLQDGRSTLIERKKCQIRIEPGAENGCLRADVLADSPLESFGMIELLPVPLVYALAGHRALLLHSCAVAYRDSGLLFTGVSGRGKSTLAGLWRRWGDDRSFVIDDEHLIVRYYQDVARLYGAPWLRSGIQSRFGDVPLKAIFFLAHGAQNRCRALSSAEALARLMSQVFLPMWSKEQMDQTLETSAQLVRDARSFELEFLPRPETIHFLQDWLEDNL